MRLFILYLLLTTAVYARAQQSDKALVRVKYHFSHMRDTTKRQDFYREDMMLIAGKNASVFLSYDKILRDIESLKALQQPEMRDGVPMFKMPPRKRPTLGTELYYFANEHRLFTLERMGTSYLTELKLEKTNWKILPGTTELEGMPCKKATANVGGRNWTVWFTEEVPLTSGPWKLFGLPGIILQARDENNEVMFDFAGLEKVEATTADKTSSKSDLKTIGSSNYLTNAEIALPTNVVKTTVAELKRLIDFSINDPQGFAKAQLAAMGMGGLKPIGDAPAPQRPQAKPFNNPIEKSN